MMHACSTTEIADGSVLNVHEARIPLAEFARGRFPAA
jgi:hypothetical protein